MTPNEYAKIRAKKERDLYRLIKQKDAEITLSHKKTVEKLNASSEALAKSQASVTEAFSMNVREFNLAYMDVQDAFRELDVPEFIDEPEVEAENAQEAEVNEPVLQEEPQIEVAAEAPLPEEPQEEQPLEEPVVEEQSQEEPLETQDDAEIQEIEAAGEEPQPEEEVAEVELYA